MKKGIIFLAMVSMIWAVLSGCGKKAGEKEYFERAYQEMGKEQWSEAEKNFQKILDVYPNGEYASKAMFMVGFVNANYLKNYDKAKKYYTEFLEKYPDNELADDAKYELEHLGKDVDDLPFLKEEESSKDSVVAANSGKSTATSQ
jgi:outer membrane protein assembly factor BamD (BamD/ComL family)